MHATKFKIENLWNENKCKVASEWAQGREGIECGWKKEQAGAHEITQRWQRQKWLRPRRWWWTWWKKLRALVHFTCCSQQFHCTQIHYFAHQIRCRKKNSNIIVAEKKMCYIILTWAARWTMCACVCVLQEIHSDAKQITENSAILLPKYDYVACVCVLFLRKGFCRLLLCFLYFCIAFSDVFFFCFDGGGGWQNLISTYVCWKLNLPTFEFILCVL